MRGIGVTYAHAPEKCDKRKLRFAHSRSAVGPWGPGPQTHVLGFFSEDFQGFCGIRVSMGIGGPRAFTQLSFSPKRAFPTPFASDFVFFRDIWLV